MKRKLQQPQKIKDQLVKKNAIQLLFFVLAIVITLVYSRCGLESKGTILNTYNTDDSRYKLIEYKPQKRINSLCSVGGTVNFVNGKDRKDVTFNCYQSEELKIHIAIPENWKIKRYGNNLIYAEIDNSSENYFIVLRQDLSPSKFTLEEYVSIVKQKLSIDTLEPFMEDKGFELDYTNENKSVISMTGITQTKDSVYKFYSLFYKKNSVFYDFTLKCEIRFFEDFKYLFEVIAFSLLEDEKRVLPVSTSRSISIGTR